jgi:aspartate aminotransferase-like enzyme
MDPETLAAGGRQPQYFRTPEFSRLMLDCADMLKETLDAPGDTKMIFLTASGTGAMEAAVMNLFTEHDKVLVVSGGTFGERFRRICDIHRIPAEVINLKWNEPFKAEMLRPYENLGFTGMLVNMCETSTGQLYPMDTIGEFCRRNQICLVVDAISSFLCDYFRMRQLGDCAVIVSSQKGLALPPGMAFVAITDKVYKKRCMENNPQTLYFRFRDYENDFYRGQTPYTPAVGIINQLHEKLSRLLREGIWLQIQYISGLAKYFRETLVSKTGFVIPEYTLSNCLTPVYCPENNAQEIVHSLKNRQGIYVTPCAGEAAAFLFRVAHMSRQLKKQDIDELIALLRSMRENHDSQ